MEKIIKWGIVGAGNIANKFAKAVKNVEGAELTAVASQSEGKGKAFADKYDIKNVFTSYEEMAKSEFVNAVYIATPHPFHKPCAEIFLNAKKHVLCEKPVCVNAKQAVKLENCAKENGVFLMEAMWTRFLPAIKEAVEIANSGEIGKIRGVKADFCYFSTPYEESKIFRNDMAGGSLLDVGVYGLNFASWYLGKEVESIDAKADIWNGIDTHTCALLKYKNGGIADISSAVLLRKPNEGYIYGTKGYVHINRFYAPQEIEIHLLDGTNKTIEAKYLGNGFEEQIIHVCECVEKGLKESPINTFEQTLFITKQMDEIREKIGVKYPQDK